MSTLFYHHPLQWLELIRLVSYLEKHQRLPQQDIDLFALESVDSVDREKYNVQTGRVLLISDPDDMVVLDPGLKKEYTYVRSHLDRAGLETSHQIIWKHYDRPLTSKLKSQKRVSLYCYSPKWHQVLQDHKRLEATSLYLLKSAALEAGKKNNIITPMSFLCKNYQSSLSIIDQVTFPVYLKPERASSGIGITFCPTKEDLIAILKSYSYFPMLLQEEVKADYFSSIHFRVKQDKIENFVTVKQTIENNCAVGHHAPHGLEIETNYMILAQQLYQDGMKGYFGFDVGIKKAADGSHQQILMECNPRFTSATYPALIAEKLGVRTWQTKRYQTPHRSLQQFDLASVTFDSKTKRGVILLDWGMLLLGEPLFMLIGDLDDQLYFDQQLQAILA